jgi:hypothetical protein
VSEWETDVDSMNYSICPLTGYYGTSKDRWFFGHLAIKRALRSGAVRATSGPGIGIEAYGKIQHQIEGQNQGRR